jgi:hypothetical protein
MMRGNRFEFVSVMGGELAKTIGPRRSWRGSGQLVDFVLLR